MNEKNSLLVVNELKKSFFKAGREIKILNNVNITVKKGEVVAITGRSGAGKSTLLHILGSLLKPDSGEIYYNNADILLYDETELNLFRNKSLGFVFQFHYLINELTAIENVLLPAMIFTDNNEMSDFEKRANLLLEYLNLHNRKNHYPYELSGGEQQRVAFARSLINSPKLLLADEPTGNIDEQSANELIKLLFSMQKDFELTIIIVTHDNNIANLCARILNLHNGEIEIVKK